MVQSRAVSKLLLLTITELGGTHFLIREAGKEYTDVVSEDFGGVACFHFNSLDAPPALGLGTSHPLETTYMKYPAALALLIKRRGMRPPAPCVLQPLPKIWLSISMTDGLAARCGTL